jgi:hypothetical protein
MTEGAEQNVAILLAHEMSGQRVVMIRLTTQAGILAKAGMSPWAL